MGHIRAGKFTIHFGPRERRIQLLLLASKVNALVIPEIVGGGGGSEGFKLLLHYCIKLGAI